MAMKIQSLVGVKMWQGLTKYLRTNFLEAEGVIRYNEKKRNI